MNPRLLEISKTRYTWSNATGNVVTNPIRYFYPEQVEDIRAIISEAEQEKLSVRAVGSGHSFSEVAKGNDFLLDMKEMRNVTPYEAPLVKPAHTNQHFILAEAGTTIRRTNRILDKMGLALINMGAVDFQTLSGALMTGTHGTGINKPAFPDMVRSIRMVGQKSELLHIEPTNGITDPVNHQRQQPFVKLIQDDDIFYSCVLSFGAMGIVYQLVMEVVPAFWIHEHRYLEKWSVVRTQLLNGTFMNKVNQHDFMSFRVNPHKIKGDHLCSIAQQNIVPKPPDGKPQGHRNRWFAFFGNMEGGLESLIKTINRNSKGRIANRIQLSTKLSAVKSYTDKSYKVLYQSGAAVLRFGISSEFAFQADGVKLVEVLEHIFKYTEFLSKYADRHHPSHIPVRFVMPSKVYLSSSYNRPTMYIDIPTLHYTIGDFELLDHYQTELMNLGGIPHWGKVNNMLYANHPFIKHSYPKWQTWFKVRQQMDPDCTFINDFILRMGLGTRVQ